MHAHRPEGSSFGQLDFGPGKVAIALGGIVPLAFRYDGIPAHDAVRNSRTAFLCELIVRPERLRHPLLSANSGIELLDQHHVWLEPFQNTRACAFVIGVILVV